METRKYDKRNKKNFILITGLFVAIICIFSLFIYRYLKFSKVEYKVLTGSVIQDVLKNNVSVEKDSLLKMKWNGNYYLTNEDGEINLGNKIIDYNTIDGSLKMYGTFYEIDENGKVSQINGETVLNNTTDAKFYKLDDREYLLVDSKIFSEDRKIEANNYLLVELDKLGNAKLSNNNLNLKTIAPTKLVTSKYTFDINNEVLNFGKKDINLKKIIGSTNEYEEKDETQKEDTVIDDNGNQVNGNNAVDIGIGTGEGAGTVINNNDIGNITDIGEILSKLKMTSIIRIIEGLSQVDVDYVIYDPYNEYKSVYVEVVGNGKIETIHLNKNETHVIIDGLFINTEYKLNFIYTTSDVETGELILNTFDSYEVKTLMPEYGISIYKISTVDERILTYKVNLDQRYSVDNVNVMMKFKYKEIDEETGEVKIKSAKLVDKISTKGKTKTAIGSFNISNYDIDRDTLIELTIQSIEVGNVTLPVKSSFSFRFGR